MHHHQKLKGPITGPTIRFPPHPLVQSVSGDTLNASRPAKILSPHEPIKEIINPRQWVRVLHRHLVKRSLTDTEPQLPVLLVHKQNGYTVRRLALPYVSFRKEFVPLGFHFLQLLLTKTIWCFRWQFSSRFHLDLVIHFSPWRQLIG